MSNRTATPDRASQRGKAARRGGPSGRLVVGEYVGQAAADAAQAVRRAGLRPGLDRSFGCEAELIGLDRRPGAGGGQRAGAQRDGDAVCRGARERAGGAGHRRARESERPSGVSVGGSWRGRGSAGRGCERAGESGPADASRAVPCACEQVFDLPPAPVPADRGSSGRGASPVAQVPAAQAWGSPGDRARRMARRSARKSPRSEARSELSHEEFVVHVDDVFAGRAGGPPAWRRVYPRRRAAAGARRRAACPCVAGRASAAGQGRGAGLAVWAMVGFASALDGQHARTPTASVISRRRPACRDAYDRGVRPSVRAERKDSPPGAAIAARSARLSCISARGGGVQHRRVGRGGRRAEAEGAGARAAASTAAAHSPRRPPASAPPAPASGTDARGAVLAVRLSIKHTKEVRPVMALTFRRAARPSRKQETRPGCSPSVL